MQKLLNMKLLIGILAAIGIIGALLVHQVHTSQGTAVDVHKLATEREKAEQIDRDDKAEIQKIRERNAQKAHSVPKQ